MASKNVKVPGLCTLMLLLLGASLLLCQVSDAGTLRSDTCQGEADTDCGGSADPSGPSGLSAEESQKNKAEMPLFPSVVRRKAGEIWNEGKGGGRNDGRTYEDAPCNDIGGALSLHVETTTESLVSKEEQRDLLAGITYRIVYNLTVHFHLLECSTREGALLELSTDHPTACSVSTEARAFSCMGAPLWQEVRGWTAVYRHHSNGSIGGEAPEFMFEGATPVAAPDEHVQRFFSGIIGQMHFDSGAASKLDTDGEMVEDSEHPDHIHKVQRTRLGTEANGHGSMGFRESRYQEPRTPGRGHVFVPRASIAHTFLHPERGLDFKQIHEIIELPSHAGDGLAAFSRISVKSTLGSVHLYKEDARLHLESVESLYPGGNYTAHAMGLVTAHEHEGRKARFLASENGTQNAAWSADLYRASWSLSPSSGVAGKIAVTPSIVASMYGGAVDPTGTGTGNGNGNGNGNGTAAAIYSFTGALKAGLSATLFGADIDIASVSFDITPSWMNNTNVFNVSYGAALSFWGGGDHVETIQLARKRLKLGSANGGPVNVTCDLKADTQSFEDIVLTKKKEFFKREFQFYAAGIVPVVVGVGIQGELQPVVAFLGCYRDNAPRVLVFAGIQGLLEASGSVGLGVKWIEVVGAQVTVSLLSLGGRGGADWNPLQVVDHANPQPTCIIGRATATGLGVQVSLFAKGVLYKTRKTIWSKKAMKLVDTYRKLCGRDIGTGSLPSPATQTDPQSGSGQPPALPAFAADGRYAMDTCPSGFRDCDARPDTGCTDILFDNQNCGECGQQVPGGMMCYKGYMVRVPLNPAVVVAKYGGYSPIEARVLPASGDLKDISQLKIHLLYNPATMATSPAIPPMMFGNKCFINGVDVTPTCSGGTACQDSGGTTLSIVSQNDQRTDYSPPLDYGVPAYEFTFDVSAAASLPAFPAGGLCIYCDIMDVPSFGWHMPCTGKLEDGSLIPAGCDPAAQEAVPPSGFRASYSLASVFGTNSLSNVGGDTSCVMNQYCECVTPGEGANGTQPYLDPAGGTGTDQSESGSNGDTNLGGGNFTSAARPVAISSFASRCLWAAVLAEIGNVLYQL